MGTLRYQVHRSTPAPLFFVAGGCSMYLGAALAVELFQQLSPAGVAWLRMLVAALALLAWRRPDRAAWRARRLILAGCFGLVTGLMNVTFYEAIARLPLGTAVAVEFCGPVVVAALGMRTVRDVTALVLAAIGVALIADARLAGSRTGLLLALLAALMWAAYIVLGKRVARGGSGLDDMSVGFAVASALLCPLAAGTGPAWRSPTLLVLAARGAVVYGAALRLRSGGATPARSFPIRSATRAVAGSGVGGRVAGPAPSAATGRGSGHRCCHISGRRRTLAWPHA